MYKPGLDDSSGRAFVAHCILLGSRSLPRHFGIRFHGTGCGRDASHGTSWIARSGITQTPGGCRVWNNARQVLVFPRLGIPGMPLPPRWVRTREP